MVVVLEVLLLPPTVSLGSGCVYAFGSGDGWGVMVVIVVGEKELWSNY